MQIRCSYCQTMFPISREETLAALEHMEDNNLKYYDAHCPNCRRANRVERFKLEASYPTWREDLKAMAKEAGKAEAKAEKKSETAMVEPPKKKTTVVPAKPAANLKTTPAGNTRPVKKTTVSGSNPAKRTITAPKTTEGKKKHASRTSKK